MSEITDHIDRNTALSVTELSDATGMTDDEVQSELERLMDEGRITSTPNWKYRLARRSDTDKET